MKMKWKRNIKNDNRKKIEIALKQQKGQFLKIKTYYVIIFA